MIKINSGKKTWYNLIYRRNSFSSTAQEKKAKTKHFPQLISELPLNMGKVSEVKSKTYRI